MIWHLNSDVNCSTSPEAFRAECVVVMTSGRPICFQVSAEMIEMSEAVSTCSVTGTLLISTLMYLRCDV